MGAPHAGPARGAGTAAPAVGRRADVPGDGPVGQATSAGGRGRRRVRWSTNQGRRWGSCTPSDGTIRISDRVRGMPRWVLDYVLLHELAHLLHAGHGPEFWAELDAYPRTLRARGFLEGYAYAAERGAHTPAGDAEADDDVRAGDEVDDGEIDEPDGVVADEVDVEDFPPDDDATTSADDELGRRQLELGTRSTTLRSDDAVTEVRPSVDDAPGAADASAS